MDWWLFIQVIFILVILISGIGWLIELWNKKEDKK